MNAKVLAGALMLALTACGHSPSDRALSGGLLGAGGGALVGGAYGNPLAGALVGGGGGALLGAATADEDHDYRHRGGYEGSGYYPRYRRWHDRDW